MTPPQVVGREAKPSMSNYGVRSIAGLDVFGRIFKHARFIASYYISTATRVTFQGGSTSILFVLFVAPRETPVLLTDPGSRFLETLRLNISTLRLFLPR
jgi:hypothetical protein